MTTEETMQGNTSATIILQAEQAEHMQWAPAGNLQPTSSWWLRRRRDELLHDELWGQARSGSACTIGLLAGCSQGVHLLRSMARPSER
jgi:hypothetical protein